MGLDSTPVQARTVLKQGTEPSNTDVIWVDTTGTTNTVKFYDGGSWKKIKPPSGPNPYDAAETWNESNLTLTQISNPFRISDGSLKIGGSPGTQISRTNDKSSRTTSVGVGHRVRPLVDLAGLKVTMSDKTGQSDPQPNEVFIADMDENIVGQTFNSNGYGPNDTVDVLASLAADTNYYVGVFNGGEDYTYGASLNNTSYNNSGDLVHAQGTYGSSVDSMHPDDSGSPDLAGQGLAVNEITAILPNTSATVGIEWPAPTDVYEWDTATYQRTLDGETVDVYVAYNDGTGWTRTNGGNPISRNYSLGDDSNISASDEIRIEAELSRTDTANNPRLDSAYRSWIV
jgi:hypothetical protein